MPRRMPREGWRGCSGTCPPHLEGGGSGRRPHRCSPPPGPGNGVWDGGQGPLRTAGLSRGVRARPLRPSRPGLGGCWAGGAQRGAPRSPHPQRGGDAVPGVPLSRLPDGFFPMHKAQLFSPEVAAPAAQPVPRHPPAADFPPLGGYFPLSMLRSSPLSHEGLEAFANFSCSR